MSVADGTTACSKEKASRVHRLGLALSLGLLGMMFFVLTANAYVAVKVDDTLVDFDRGSFVYTGLLDIPDKGIHSVQLLPVGLTGEWQTSPQHLPERRADMATAANGNALYVIGGTDPQNNPRTEVYSTIISDVWGTLVPWRTEAPLPGARTGAAGAVEVRSGATSILYVVGGLAPGWSATSTVYRAQINNTTGHIVGGWTTDAQSLPESLYYASAIVHNGFLYVLGGTNVLQSFDTVYYAEINADGSLQPFATTSAMPEALFDGYAVVYDGDPTDTIYYVGGAYITGTFDVDSTFEVYFADVNPNGSLTAWTRSDGALPRHIYAHSGLLINQGEILITGGIDDPLDPMNSFTSTVKAALVDPANPSFRLYDWCLGEQPPTCTIGAWQTGELLPDVRALHGTEGGRGYVYVMGGEDGQQRIRDTVFFGTVNGVGALYSPEGTYRSQEFDLEQPAKLRKLTWNVTLGHANGMGLSMQYRTSADGQIWTNWSAAEDSLNGFNELVPNPIPTGLRYIQYQANFTTAVSNSSPLLDEVRIYYEVPDPDMQVIKNTGDVISVALDTTLQYTIHYTNTGGWVAKDVVLTETLPEHTSYVPEPGWHQVGSSNVYTYRVGNVPWGDTGSANFRVHVDPDVPFTTRYITNQIEIDYPPMTDAFLQTITDPNLDDNLAKFRTPLSHFALTVTKQAEPPSGSDIWTPGSIITYTLLYTNIGDIPATQAVLTDTFGTIGAYTVISPSLPADAKEYVWDVGPLPPKAAGKKTIVVQLNEPLPHNWPITNTAVLSSPNADLYKTAVLTHTFKRSGAMVDLTVSDIQWTPPEPYAGVPANFRVTVSNLGTMDAGQPGGLPLWIELYIKPRPSSPPSLPSDHDLGLCLNGCAQIRPDFALSLSKLPAGTAADVLFTGADLVFPKQDTCYDVYAQIDVGDVETDNLYWGRYPEADETNNIAEAFYCTGGPPKTYLPMIFKNAP